MASGAGPGDPVRSVSFVSGASQDARVLPDNWHFASDVAFLRLDRPLPEDMQPVTLR
jgi:hypothetical protein